MRLERDMTEEDVRSLYESPTQFASDECDRLRDFLLKEGHLKVGEDTRVIGGINVNHPIRKIQAYIVTMAMEDVGMGGIRTEGGDEAEEVLLDVVPGNAGQYNLFALVPGISKEDIKISKYGNTLEIRAKDYVGKAKLPEGITEISKAYENGVLKLILR